MSVDARLCLDALRRSMLSGRAGADSPGLVLGFRDALAELNVFAEVGVEEEEEEEFAFALTLALAEVQMRPRNREAAVVMSEARGAAAPALALATALLPPGGPALVAAVVEVKAVAAACPP